MVSKFRAFARFMFVSSLIAAPAIAQACSSCGCTLNSDWASQGYAAGEGIFVDLRYDYINQTELRSGRNAVNRGGIAFPAGDETQQLTRSRTYNLGLDYRPVEDWAVNLQVPYLDRFHTTVAGGDTDVSASQTNGIGDVRLVGRFMGLSEDRNSGLQLGLKLPTGKFHTDFNAGPQTGTPLDRGLQSGTGTTDLILGAYRFGELSAITSS